MLYNKNILDFFENYVIIKSAGACYEQAFQHQKQFRNSVKNFDWIGGTEHG